MRLKFGFIKLIKGDLLHDVDHVIRHVRKARLRRDEDGNVIGFLAQAFELRENETSLSVNRLEYFNGDLDVRIRLSVLFFRHNFNIKSSCAFAIGNVGKVKEISQQNNATIRIVYSPTDDIPNHSDIRRFPRDDMAFLDALALDAFTQIVLNSDIA